MHRSHLAGICPIVTASDYHENWTCQGGAFEQWFAASWTSLALSRDTLRDYLGLRAQAGSDAARRGQRLIVAVGGHAGEGLRVGARDFGADSAFDEDAVTLFVMGANRWRDEAAWPLARALPSSAATSAVDTDFTGMLVDVWPDGFAQNLTSGILRMRCRNSTAGAESVVPGRIYRITLDLWATSNVFRAGHRLCLEVSSSNFPRLDRNLNTGEPQATATRAVAATNTVYHHRRRPSALIVPVVP